MGKLTRDTANIPVQVFSPVKIISVTASVEWTPDVDDRAFRIPNDCTYTLDGSSNSASVIGGTITGISPGRKFTFDTSMNIEVM